MLLHFKLNCYIVLMLLLGHINLGEKLSQNIDAFFDPAVDHIQDNFYDIPYIPPENQQKLQKQQNENDELSEQDVFEFGREALLLDDFVKRDCDDDTSTTTDHKCTDGLLDSIVEKFNDIGRKKNTLYLKMKRIEDDEAVLERNSIPHEKRIVRRSNEEDVDAARDTRRRFVNPIYFIHKFRPKRRNCKKLKMPHKHRPMETILRASKQEAFKDNLLNDDQCGDAIVITDAGNCNDTVSRKKNVVEVTTITTPEPTETTAAATTATATAIPTTVSVASTSAVTERKHKPQGKSKSTSATSTSSTATSSTGTTASVTAAGTKKSSLPPSKTPIKSVLCHKPSTEKPKELEEYGDYKVDYIEDKFHRKSKRNPPETTTLANDTKTLEQYVNEETAPGPKTGMQPVPGSLATATENIIENFLKDETTKSEFTLKTDFRRNLSPKVTSTTPPTPTINQIEHFLSSEIPKDESRTEEMQPGDNILSKRDFLLDEVPFLTPVFSTKRRKFSTTSRSKEMVRFTRFKQSTTDYDDYDAQDDLYEAQPAPRLRASASAAPVFLVKTKHHESMVNINEMNKKLYKEPKGDIYVPHIRNQGKHRHPIYYERERPQKKLNKKIHVFESKNANRHRRHRRKNTKKSETEEEEDEESTEVTEPEPVKSEPQDQAVIDELYKEIPVDSKHIELALNCDRNDYINKDHCICSITTMLHDLMDDLKDINLTNNYQYDCTKYISIQPGIVISNDSIVLLRNKRLYSYLDNILLRRGSRMGRDVDDLLDTDVEATNDLEVFAMVGSKIELHCGNESDYKDDDKIVWTVGNGAPETAGIKEDAGRSLIIERVGPQDTNNYTCEISHLLEDGSYGSPKKILHRLSIVDLPVYSIMVTILLNESSRCEQEDLDTLHHYYPIMLKKLVCSDSDEICHISLDTPFCTKTIDNVKSGVTMHATLKTGSLHMLLPDLKNREEECGISCQSRIYSAIVKTMLYNFMSITNLPGIMINTKSSSRSNMISAIRTIPSLIPFYLYVHLVLVFYSMMKNCVLHAHPTPTIPAIKRNALSVLRAPINQIMVPGLVCLVHHHLIIADAFLAAKRKSPHNCIS